MSTNGPEIVAGIRADLARWREALAELEAGGGFDTQRSMISAWIKEGERLLSRIEDDLKG
jgi:hypothetical protein